MNNNQPRKWFAPFALLIAGALLLAAGLMLSVTDGGDQPDSAANVDASDGAARVSVQDAHAAYQEGTAVLVDVRSTASYENIHIPGSRSIPLSEIAGSMDDVNPDDWIITICA